MTGNDPQADRAALPGERATAGVSGVRAVSARMSSILAVGLMSTLGIGLLVWYYAGTFARQSGAHVAVQDKARHRAQGDLPLPPIGTIERPPFAVAGDERPARADGLDATPGDLAAVEHAPPPAPLPAVPVQPEAATTSNLTPATPGPAQLALERRLSGAAFSVQGAAAGPLPGPAAISGVPSRDPTSAATLATLLQPSTTTAVRAAVLPSMRLLLPKGAFIDCTLETAIDSTLPGMTTCVTATDTFGVDGKVVLLERGTKLVGETRGQVQQGAARVFVLWSEARTPTGVVVPLDSPGADELGRAGLPGDVNRHFWERFGAAMLISVLDGAAQAAVQSSSRSGNVVLSPAASEGVATEALKSTVAIPPTVQKSQGDRIQVLVARDLDFRSVYALRTDAPGRKNDE